MSQVPLLFHGHRNDAVNHGPFVAPGAEGRVSADHGKAAAKLGHKARGVFQLLLGEDFLRDIAVDDHVVFEQFLHGLREPMDRMLDAVDLVSAFRIDEGHLRVQRRRAAELLAIKGLYEDAGSGFNRVFQIKRQRFAGFGGGRGERVAIGAGRFHVDDPKRLVHDGKAELLMIVHLKPLPWLKRNVHMVGLESGPCRREFQIDPLAFARQFNALFNDRLAVLDDPQRHRLARKPRGAQGHGCPRHGLERYRASGLHGLHTDVRRFVGSTQRHGVNRDSFPCVGPGDGLWRLQ